MSISNLFKIILGLMLLAFAFLPLNCLGLPLIWHIILIILSIILAAKLIAEGLN